MSLFLRAGITLVVFSLGFLSLYNFCQADVANNFVMTNDEFVCGVLFRIFLTFLVWIVCSMLGDRLVMRKS